ncbi:type II toxin-antitoxin system tRNA(fMet)-specific endonuclease VapC [Dethiobacter alkaliphilus]|uniref:type II toxin-antitoxin system tRNA(fMet)-specific endonuclease VapC n=1 Tax=Dethiobacter alkaliphilus TaxID=427926 RepID=UPI0022267059|nr:type II toxin-antitoxin system VapC family toxin [Dethiobacter alkaliphilus]MCW3489791.1 type II toxin-antitoxin system VapC family toxin [Dethiobacter alkaliphilus]
MKYYLDTNTCIYFLKGLYPVLLNRIMSQNPDDIKIASMVKAELLYGAHRSQRSKENIEKVEQFLLPFEIVPFGNNAAEQYSKIRSALERAGTPIGPNDLIISATALANNGVLVTNNEKEFNRISDLIIENWIK